MKNIVFLSENNNELEFVQVLKKRANEYFKKNKISKKGNIKMYFKTFCMISLYLTPFILLLTVKMSLILALGMTVLMGIGEAGIGMCVMHDGAHGSYSSKSWVNKLMASSMFLLGSNIVNWKIQHNVSHHTFTNIYNYDPDISTKAVIRLCDHAPLKKYHRFQQFYAFPLYGLMTLLRLIDDFSTLIKNNKSGATSTMNVNPSMELVKLIITKAVYLSVIFSLPLIFTDFAFWQILVGFIVMHFTAGMIMSTVFQMAHVVEGAYQPMPDAGVIHHEWMVHQLKATSDFGRKNGLLSWYIGGLDFQVEHHLFTDVCHIHYSDLAQIVEKTAQEYGLTYNSKRTFLHAFKSHFRRLKELGRTKV